MDNIVPPFAPQPVYIVIAAIMAIILGLWMAWRITRFNAIVTPQLRQVTQRQRRTWNDEMAQILSDYSTDHRRFHLETAKFLRGVSSTRVGTDVTSWTVSDIRQAGLADLAHILSICENPSFAPEGEGDPQTVAGKVQGVLASW